MWGVMIVNIREMTLDYYEDVTRLWSETSGIGLSNADSKANIARYLERNPGFSFVAIQEEQVVGAILCGHDGRRGYIHHLAIEKDFRRHGVGRALVERCLTVLKAVGINKCHLFVCAENPSAQAFWQDIGWSLRTDLVIMSRYTNDA